MAKVLLVDNVDSFTYNIADLLHRVLGQPPTVWRNDHSSADLSGFDAIVVGPGPGRPQHAADMGLSDVALRQRAVPVLGVCLGHQGMAHLAGDEVVELGTPFHGLVSSVEHDGTGLFEGIPSPFSVVRYHSLEVRLTRSSPLLVTARSADDGVVMALADPSARRWGVQFHPESVLSQHGERLVANFLRMAGLRSGGQARRMATALSDAPAGGPEGVPLGTPAGGPAEARAADVGSGQSGAVAVGDVHRHARPARTAARAVRLAAARVGGAVDTWELHRELLADSPTAFWLDASTSALGGVSGTPPLPPAVRCSVLGDASGPLSYVLTHRVGSGSELSTGERLGGPLLANLALLRDRLEVRGDVDLPTAYRPGFVGYLGYELKAETGGSAAHRSPFPDARLLMADRAVVVDHDAGDTHAVWLWDDATRTTQESWVERVRTAVQASSGSPRVAVDRATVSASRAASEHLPEHSRPPELSPRHTQPSSPHAELGSRPTEPVWRHTRSQYVDLVAACQRLIRAGESYEICLTNAARWPERVDEAQLYRLLRRASPVPFGAWLRGPGPSVLSASPERFVSVTADGLVESRPIKGTRPRGADPTSDTALLEDLRTSVKDRAENLMIVDLLRNDLHRVCRSGSVHVPAIFEVESYSTVHQLVSTVRGQLVEGMDALDVIGTCFPGGSMTGAPKVRTMDILDRLEGGPRGVYSGAVGWIGLDGAMDLSIVIRTVTVADGVAEFGAGGAITALSDEQEEYAETLVKARAITSALRAAGRGIHEEGSV